jgi:uncharacterized protein (TIGR03000 family)
MYSVVLMMAMTGSADTPEFFGRGGCCGGYSCNGGGCYGGGCYGGGCYGGGHGCSGYGGCHGGYGCSGSCHGGGHGLFGGGCHGGGLFSRHGGCHGGYSCCGCCGGGYSGCYGGGCYGGCTGGYAGCNGGYGGCYGGCTGGYTGCVGGAPTMIVVPEKKEVKKEEGLKTPPKEEGKPEARFNAPATIIVSLPAEAKLSIDDAMTTSTSAQRVFQSPELPAGRTFVYTLKAQFSHEGRPVIVSKNVNVRAGEETRVTISAADLSGVASR